MNIEAIDFLNQLNEYGKIDYADYSHLHDLLTSEEPQGEPSDAQVLGVLRARIEFNGTTHGDDAWWRGHVQGMKDAVFDMERAAWEVAR